VTRRLRARTTIFTDYPTRMPSCSQKKRGLSGGENGKDVQAVQRAVSKALQAVDLTATNAQNGQYGENTISDVAAWQGTQSIKPTGQTGQPTLASLWPYMDAYGVSLYFKAKIGVASDLPDGRLVLGQQGNRVRAAQQMLWRALGDESRNARNGVYGEGVSADVRHYLGVADLAPGDGKQISQSLWEMLWAFGDEYAHDLVQKADTPAPGSGVRSNLVTEAEDYVRLGGSYAQVRPYQRHDPLANAALRNDCSGSIHHLMLVSGGPDPSARGFDGAGYTGTMLEHGDRVELGPGLVAGDCVFYGSGPTAQHVAMILDQGRLFTFGSNPPTITLYSTYWTSGRRADLGARRYIS
jgi:peptidoglycan hydrolase-like protein with peptidoglycan-binding domain